MNKLEETTADLFYTRPEIYLKCIEAGAKYLEKEPYPQNDQNIKWDYGYHPEKVTSRERWWKEAIKPIKDDLKNHFGPGYTKMIRLIYKTLADEGNTAIKNVQQFISTGTCEQYEAFSDAPDEANAGGQFMNVLKCTDCGAPLTKEEIETYGDVCEACSFDFGKDRHYDGPDVADLYESIINEGTNNKKNFIDIKGEKAKLKWTRPEMEKVGFGEKELKESKLKESGMYDYYDQAFPGLYDEIDWFLEKNSSKEDFIKWLRTDKKIDNEKIINHLCSMFLDEDLNERAKKLASNILNESEEPIIEAFSDFCYQIYNGGVEQPIGINSHYYERICKLLSTYGSANNLLDLIYAERKTPEDTKSCFEQFVRDVCTVCEAVENTTFYTGCTECGGSGEISEEDEDGEMNYETCWECHGDGEVSCGVEELDYPETIVNYLKGDAKEAWTRLDNIDFDILGKVFKGE